MCPVTRHASHHVKGSWRPPEPKGLLPHLEAKPAKPSFGGTPVSSRNIGAMSSLHEALQPLMIAFLSREVHSERLRRSKEIGVVGYPAMKPDMKSKKGREGSNMLKKLLGAAEKLLGAAAMAASAYAFVPAHAAQVGIGCSGEAWPEPKARSRL